MSTKPPQKINNYRRLIRNLMKNKEPTPYEKWFKDMVTSGRFKPKQ